ncbi:DUF2835 family protein [Algicola sagamiensis]|uniref:DUF2835 family protein n=1 Tax=Algicola sagamiensis TaxID=163869 RepID=UPI0009FDBCD4|nr:DUF2835 family protein [Algicola sagamiensis]
MSNKVYFFSVNLSKELCLSFYRGETRYVHVVTDGGIRIQIPVHHFMNFVTNSGIKGRFRLVLNEKATVISLEQLTHN